MKKCRTFDAQFKLEVVHMIKDQDLSVSQVSKTTGVGETAIRAGLRRMKQSRP
ncbi:hypothetical protein [Advenella mimigardefordensis]|uniref:Putative transposase n=1 Tax=Advenella mimigardefordensis (strain DSM 17166 / LMG 22922 / DPN7) TaxID=1247726 RepID=W0PK81_ADVMD|nr:hypothetical protein [Advenella mimigardefordensis]AHG65398.1 putative transposase [Advenella mimigardefordensis DPN7]